MVQASSLIILLGAALGAQACIGPPVNQATVDLVASFEGFVDHPYNDPTGHPTIGYGHLCADASCSDVKYPKPLSQADGKRLLAADMATAQNCITTITADPVTLNLNQYGALCSWAFNIGCGQAKSSSLIGRLNQGENPKTVIPNELPKWNKSNGQVLPGLTRRRQAEVDLANTATSAPALPANC
ncbi:Protein p15 [Cladobotryum mycophilum]|uniref:Protein p15 n=1 Tax=Cladobotryum mycophilum TaxID=491253 RepID=A0ABR0STC7_9HYPO